MKKILLYLGLGLVLLMAVFLLNAVRVSSKQMVGVPLAPKIPVSDSVVQHLSTAIRFRTVSFGDVALMDSTQFEKFISFLAQTYPLCHSRLQFERVNGYALLYQWKGQDPALKPALLMGHYDVVPVIQGTEKMWKHQPFAGDIDGDYVYGRGTIDNKMTVIGVLEAVEYLLQQSYQPKRSLILAFGHDEEMSGRNGGQKIAQLLEERKIALEYVVDEGGVIKNDGNSGITKPIALVGVAEKGYTTLQLTATGEGGHSSRPPAQTSIGMLAEAIDKLQKHPFPTQAEGAMTYMQEYLASEMPFGQRIAIANSWLLQPVVNGALAKTSSGNAMLRTTIAPTVINAGVKDNVLPIDATARINFRIMPGDSVRGVINYVKKVIDNEQITAVSNPDTDSNPSAVSDTATFGFRTIHRTIKSCYPDAIVSPYLVIAATDSRYYHKICKSVYRFMPVRLNEEDLARPHGTNERISKQDFKNAVQFYVTLIKNS